MADLGADRVAARVLSAMQPPRPTDGAIRCPAALIRNKLKFIPVPRDRIPAQPFYLAREAEGLTRTKGDFAEAFRGMPPGDFQRRMAMIPYTGHRWKLLTGKANV